MTGVQEGWLEIAVADLSIDTGRLARVDFSSVPIMTGGTGILMRRPSSRDPGIYSQISKYRKMLHYSFVHIPAAVFRVCVALRAGCIPADRAGASPPGPPGGGEGLAALRLALAGRRLTARPGEPQLAVLLIPINSNK